MIGASRVTYSMASYRQIPEVFRRLHPRFKTPVLSLVIFAGDRADPDPPSRRRELRRHALLVRRHALVHRRARLARAAADEAEGTTEAFYRADRTSCSGRIQWPLFAIVGGLATGASFLVIVTQNPTTRWVGLGWIVFGLSGTSSTGAGSSRWRCATTRQGAAGLRSRARARVPADPRPGRPGRAFDDALDVACASPTSVARGSIALTVIEVPLDLPLDAELPRGSRTLANRRPRRGGRDRRRYDVRVTPRLVRGRSASVEIVDEARARSRDHRARLPAEGADASARVAVFGRPSTA